MWKPHSPRSPIQLIISFFLIQVCLGAIIGISVQKTPTWGALGGLFTIFASVAAIVELIVVNIVRKNDGTLGAVHLLGNLLSTLLLVHPLWLVCLVFSLVGYLFCYVVTWHLGVGRGQFSVVTLLIVVALYALVAGFARVIS
jgi:prolipoprotein diacylglyceryltransferase